MGASSKNLDKVQFQSIDSKVIQPGEQKYLRLLQFLLLASNVCQILTFIPYLESSNLHKHHYYLMAYAVFFSILNFFQGVSAFVITKSKASFLFTLVSLDSFYYILSDEAMSSLKRYVKIAYLKLYCLMIFQLCFLGRSGIHNFETGAKISLISIVTAYGLLGSVSLDKICFKSYQISYTVKRILENLGYFSLILALIFKRDALLLYFFILPLVRTASVILSYAEHERKDRSFYLKVFINSVFKNNSGYFEFIENGQFQTIKASFCLHNLIFLIIILCVSKSIIGCFEIFAMLCSSLNVISLVVQLIHHRNIYLEKKEDLRTIKKYLKKQVDSCHFMNFSFIKLVGLKSGIKHRKDRFSLSSQSSTSVECLNIHTYCKKAKYVLEYIQNNSKQISQSQESLEYFKSCLYCECHTDIENQSTQEETVINKASLYSI